MKGYYYGEEAGPNPIRAALQAIVGKAPPKWLKGYSTTFGTDAERTELQDWVNSCARPFWSTGIGILEAADHIVREAVANANIPPAEYWRNKAAEQARLDREHKANMRARKQRSVKKAKRK